MQHTTRQIVLDTETTGLTPEDGHRIIEIGCVEIINRRITGKHYHQYLQPDRGIDAGAVEVHGITEEFLQDKPRFCDIADSFLEFIKGAELVIHNAPFDTGFINHEFRLIDPEHKPVQDWCMITDTLEMARRMHPGQKNNLDALCRRYEIDNTHRELHGALLDAEILADVYLAMTGGQVALSLGNTGGEAGQGAVAEKIRRLPDNRPPLPVSRAGEDELAEHRARLEAIAKAAGGTSVWDRLGLD